VKKRKFLPVAIALVAVIAVSGVAYAYWTAGGSGTGTAKAAAGTVPVQAYITSGINPMYPGDSAQTISGDFTNTNSGLVRVSTVTVSISSVILADGTTVGTPATCSAGDFTLANATSTVNAEIAVTVAPAHTGAWGADVTPPTIKFNDTGANQDACKGATVHFLLAVS
jgi:hypothetical protein